MIVKNFLISSFLSLMLLMCVSSVYATPPTNLKLTYDLKSKKLLIQMTHVSTNVREHYIRNFEVFINEKSVKEKRLVKQTTGRELVQEISIDAQKGDIIRVKAICNEAGTAEASMTVEEDDKAEDKLPKTTATNSEFQNSPTPEVEPVIDESKSGY